MKKYLTRKWLPVWLLLLGMSTACSNAETPPTVHTVEIKGMKFEPALLIVEKGDSVIWVNKDIVAHDVTEETTEVWSSSKLTSGKSWGMTITKDFDYICNLHKVMQGKLRIKKD